MKAPTDVRNVYVHAPFCARRCCYCDFAVEVDRRPDSAEWLAAVRTELEWVEGSGTVRLSPLLETLYVGGGTPSLLDPRRVAELAAVFGHRRTRAPDFEWTVEANPESFTGRVARRWAEGGVNRVSFGVQSFSRAALRWMGRLHSADDAEVAVETARAAGMSNLSIDLIFGLPAAVSRDWKGDLARALTLRAPHISLYGLTVEKGTPLARAVGEGRTTPCGESRYREEYLLAAETLARAGYEHYEVSNFALPGFASRHNTACWQGAPYLGLGNGAHSYAGGRRWWNERGWAVYRDQVIRTGSGLSGEETPAPRQTRLEGVWLALRTRKGLSMAGLDPAAASVADHWKTRGLAARKDGTVHLTPEGWLLLDALTLELDAVLERSDPEGPAGPPGASGPVDAGGPREIFKYPGVRHETM